MDPITFLGDAGQPGYSAKVNRMIRQDIRMGRLIGTQCTWSPCQDDGTTRFIYVCRYPYRPQRNPYDRLFLAFEYDGYSGVGVVNPLFMGPPEYTVDDGATWRPIALNTAFASWSGSSNFGSYDLDLTAINAATWIGARLPFHASAGNGFDLLLRLGIAFLYRSEYPPF
jgi:hypothetical protein